MKKLIKHYQNTSIIRLYVEATLLVIAIALFSDVFQPISNWLAVIISSVLFGACFYKQIMEGKKESEERQRETDEKYYAEKWVEGFRSYLDRELENANPFETITGFEIKQKVPKGALELLQQKEKRVDGFERIPSGTGWNVVLKH